MSDKIKCPSCGREIKATAKFCGFCAAKIETKPVEIHDEKNYESAGENSSAYINPLEGVIPSGGKRGKAVSTTIDENVVTNNEPKKEVEVSTGKLCTLCGKKMGPKAKFCGVCGGTLVEDTSSKETSEELSDNDLKSELSKVDEPHLAESKAENKRVSGNDEIVAKADDSIVTNSTSVRVTGISEGIHPDFKPAGDL